MSLVFFVGLRPLASFISLPELGDLYEGCLKGFRSKFWDRDACSVACLVTCHFPNSRLPAIVDPPMGIRLRILNVRNDFFGQRHRGNGRASGVTAMTANNALRYQAL